MNEKLAIRVTAINSETRRRINYSFASEARTRVPGARRHLSPAARYRRRLRSRICVPPPPAPGPGPALRGAVINSQLRRDARTPRHSRARTARGAPTPGRAGRGLLITARASGRGQTRPRRVAGDLAAAAGAARQSQASQSCCSERLTDLHFYTISRAVWSVRPPAAPAAGRPAVTQGLRDCPGGAGPVSTEPLAKEGPAPCGRRGR